MATELTSSDVARPSTAALIKYFLYLGSAGFGGPVALIGYMQRDLVERRGWFTREEYLKSLALSQLAPGPLAAQVAICLGYVHSRVWGATLVALAFVLPSFLMTLYDALYDFCQKRAGTAALSPPRVLFVCLHGAAKSVVAAAHFPALAKAQGLKLAAVAAGTEPDTELTPAAVKGLADDGLSPAPGRPRPVTLHDLHTATRIVTFGCDVTSPAGRPVERWDDVPAVGDGYDGARTKIVERLRRLVGDLAESPAR